MDSFGKFMIFVAVIIFAILFSIGVKAWTKMASSSGNNQTRDYRNDRPYPNY